MRAFRQADIVCLRFARVRTTTLHIVPYTLHAMSRLSDAVSSRACERHNNSNSGTTTTTTTTTTAGTTTTTTTTATTTTTTTTITTTTTTTTNDNNNYYSLSGAHRVRREG